MTLTPAYGRDYKSKKEVQADLDAGKDFKVASMFNGGGYINKADMLREGIKNVMIRYKKLTQIQNFTVQA